MTRKTFIPKPYRKEVVTIRIGCERLEEMDQILARYQVTRSEFINRCIEFALENVSLQLERGPLD